MKQFEYAIIDYSNALLLNPYDVDLYRWRGRAYKKLDQLDRALEDYLYASRLAPYESDVRKDLGYALAKKERYEEAVESFYAATLYKKDDGRLWYNIGWYLHHRLGRREEALEALDKATELKPAKNDYSYQRIITLNELKDCEVTNAMDQYLRLCRSQANCESERVRWVKQANKYLKANYCQDTAIASSQSGSSNDPDEKQPRNKPSPPPQLQ